MITFSFFVALKWELRIDCVLSPYCKTSGTSVLSRVYSKNRVCITLGGSGGRFRDKAGSAKHPSKSASTKNNGSEFWIKSMKLKSKRKIFKQQIYSPKQTFGLNSSRLPIRRPIILFLRSIIFTKSFTFYRSKKKTKSLKNTINIINYRFETKTRNKNRFKLLGVTYHF